MSEVFTIAVQPRDPQKNKGTGTRVARRLRAQGQVPAIIYGHKQDPQPISLTRDDVWLMIKKGARLAQLQSGETTEMVLVRDVQWDHLGKEIIHLDFARVSAEERIETQVNVQLHGTAPGLAEGGTLEFQVHALDVACRADAIPDVIRVELSGLHLGDGVHVRDLVLPEGVTVTADPDLLVVQVARPASAVEPEAAEGTSTEPEVIGRKAEDKDEDEKTDKAK